MKPGENPQASVGIRIEDKVYKVIRFSKFDYKNVKLNREVKQVDKPSGYVVFDSDNKIVRDKEKIKKILEVYILWHHFYINHVFKDININPFLLRNSLYFNRLMVNGIRRRQEDNYEKILKKTNKEYVDILKELDNQVIEQSPFLIKKVKAQLALIDLLGDVWERPSDELFEKMQELFEEIKINANQENSVWSVRQNYWHKLKEYNDKKISEIKPEFHLTKKSILLSLVEWAITKNFNFLGVILEKLYEAMKYLTKPLLYLSNNKIVYHQFGIFAIEKQIAMNRKLKELSSQINQIKSESTISLLRTDVE